MADPLRFLEAELRAHLIIDDDDLDQLVLGETPPTVDLIPRARPIITCWTLGLAYPVLLRAYGPKTGLSSGSRCFELTRCPSKGSSYRKSCSCSYFPTSPSHSGENSTTMRYCKIKTSWPAYVSSLRAYVALPSGCSTIPFETPLRRGRSRLLGTRTTSFAGYVSIRSSGIWSKRFRFMIGRACVVLISQIS